MPAISLSPPPVILDDAEFYRDVLRRALNSGRSKADIARALSVPANYVSRWLAGTRSVSHNYYPAIRKAFARDVEKALKELREKGGDYQPLPDLNEGESPYQVELRPQTVPLVTQRQARAMGWSQTRMREVSGPQQSATIMDPNQADCLAVKLEVTDEDSDVGAGYIVIADPAAAVPPGSDCTVLVVFEDPETKKERTVVRRHVMADDQWYILGHVPGADGDDEGWPLKRSAVRYLWRVRGVTRCF